MSLDLSYSSVQSHSAQPCRDVISAVVGGLLEGTLHLLDAKIVPVTPEGWSSRGALEAALLNLGIHSLEDSSLRARLLNRAELAAEKGRVKQELKNYDLQFK